MLLELDVQGLAAMQVASTRAVLVRSLHATQGLTLGGPPSSAYAASLCPPGVAAADGTADGSQRGSLSVAADGNQTWRFVGEANKTDASVQLAADEATISTQSLRFMASDDTVWSPVTFAPFFF